MIEQAKIVEGFHSKLNLPWRTVLFRAAQATLKRVYAESCPEMPEDMSRQTPKQYVVRFVTAAAVQDDISVIACLPYFESAAGI